VNLRRTLTLGTVGLVASGVLGACGFNYATDRINNITAAANYRDGTVEVLNAVIVSRRPDAGTFVAGFANNDQTKTISFTGMTGDGTAVANVDAAQPFPIDPNGYVNLAAEGGIPVNGTFTAGQVVTLTLAFDDGESATFDVPVVTDAGQWAGLDHAKQSPSSSPAAPSSSASPSS
jgi:copper(I)-binding protein